MLSGSIQDLRYVIRLLARSRTFTAVAVLSLAIGIGANSAIYSVIRVLLLDPMPVAAPEELALVYWQQPGALSISQMNSSGYSDPDTGLQYRSNVSYPIYRSLVDASPEGVQAAGFNFLRELSVAFEDRPAILAGGLVADGQYFAVLRPGLTLGRPLDASDNVPGAPITAVLSHAFWVRACGGDPGVLGESIRVNGVPATVVGVTAEGFRGLSKGGFFPQTDVTLALQAVPRLVPGWEPDSGSLFSSDRQFWIRLMARIPAGTAGSTVESRLLSALQPHLAPLAEPGAQPPSVRLVPGARGLDQVRPETRRLLFILLGVVGVVLLIACVNLASLMLARGVARQRELAMRRALGAGRARLVRPLLLEGLCLALAGGAAGLLFTAWSRRALTGVLTAGLGTSYLSTQPLEVAVDVRLVAWTVGVSVLAAVLCSLLPALRLTRVDPMAHLKHQAAGASTPKLAVGRALIALQVAASVPLLVGAALFLQTLSNLGRTELGFDPEGLAFFALDPVATGAPAARYPFIYQDVLNRLQAVPGVTSATLMENVLLSGVVSNNNVTVGGQRHNLYLNAVGPGFLETMGMRLLAGRAPGLQDGPGAPLVGVVNETAARELFEGTTPIGQVIPLGRRQIQVVGVVSDTRYSSQRAAVRPTLFDAALQQRRSGSHSVVVRTSVPVARLEPAIRQAVADVSLDLPVPEIKTQVAQMDETIARERVFTQVLTLFGGFALLLASIGLHGVTAYSVSRRRSEIGVRVALGARPGQVLWLVLRQVVVLGVVGLLVGVPLAAATAPLVEALLYGVEPTDARLIAAAAGVMLMVAVLAGVLPARRAARIDPLEALRAE